MQPLLVVIAVASIPWMLLAKPFFLRREHQQKVQAGASFLRLDESSSHGINEGDSDHIGEVIHSGEDSTLHKEEGDEEEFDFSEVCIYKQEIVNSQPWVLECKSVIVIISEQFFSIAN